MPEKPSGIKSELGKRVQYIFHIHNYLQVASLKTLPGKPIGTKPELREKECNMNMSPPHAHMIHNSFGDNKSHKIIVITFKISPYIIFDHIFSITLPEYVWTSKL